jgi:GNAT superfamily N-acetyltransferase
MVSYLNRLATWIWPNRAADPSKKTVLEDSAPFFAYHWSGARQENWYLDMLAVHPDHQKKQHGRELVQWGLDEAVMESVCASVIAADGKERFYGRCGFVEVGRANVGPLAKNGIKGGAIMFTDVESKQ